MAVKLFRVTAKKRKDKKLAKMVERVLNFKSEEMFMNLMLYGNTAGVMYEEETFWGGEKRGSISHKELRSRRRGDNGVC